MAALLGIALVFAAVLGGFLLEQGNPYVLMQPAEALIIGGAAVGIIVVANPPEVIRKMARGAAAAFRQSVHTRQSFLRALRMLYEIFYFAQRAGNGELESHVDHPDASKLFTKYPEILADRATLDFVCDSLRMLVIGVTTPNELDQLMDLDIDVQRQARLAPVSALSSVADALPGLGILAAVLGVVITMGAIGGAPETIGEKVAAALVGTFLGILLCYGVVGPVASRMENMSAKEAQFFQVLRTAIAAYARGSSPLLAIEYARRSIPAELRPDFAEMETAMRRMAKAPDSEVPPAAPTPSLPPGKETAHAEPIHA